MVGIFRLEPKKILLAALLFLLLPSVWLYSGESCTTSMPPHCSPYFEPHFALFAQGDLVNLTFIFGFLPGNNRAIIWMSALLLLLIKIGITYILASLIFHAFTRK